MANEAFIEVNRKGGGKARIRADAITALVEVDPKETERQKPVVQIHLGPNNFITVQDEPLPAIWNKMCQALGSRQIPCISETAPEFPGHPKSLARVVAANKEDVAVLMTATGAVIRGPR